MHNILIRYHVHKNDAMKDLFFRFYGRIAEEANSHEADTLKAIRDNMAGLKGKPHYF